MVYCYRIKPINCILNGDSIYDVDLNGRVVVYDDQGTLLHLLYFWSRLNHTRATMNVFILIAIGGGLLVAALFEVKREPDGSGVSYTLSRMSPYVVGILLMINTDNVTIPSGVALAVLFTAQTFQLESKILTDLGRSAAALFLWLSLGNHVPTVAAATPPVIHHLYYMAFLNTWRQGRI